MFMRTLAAVCAVGCVAAAVLSVVYGLGGDDDWRVFLLDAVGLGAAALVLRHFIRRGGS
jgi:hypothetical protein